MTNTRNYSKICANLGGGIMQKEQSVIAIEAVRKSTTKFVNQEYRDKMVSMGNKCFQKMHRELLKEYKEQLLENFKKFQNLKNITKEELLSDLSFVREINSSIEELEHYYEGTRVRTVKEDIDNLRELMNLYQISNLEQELEGLSSDKTIRKEDMVTFDRIQNGMKQLQTILMEKGILIPEKEETPSNLKKIENSEEVTAYKQTLKESLKMIQNLKDTTVLDLLTMIQNYFEIEDKKGALHSYYQYVEDMNTRMDILYIFDALESCEQALPLASYFDKMSLDTKIGDYLKTISQKEREEIEGMISNIQLFETNTIDDYDEEKLLDFDSVLKDVNTKLDSIQNESVDDMIDSLEVGGVIPAETSEVKEENQEEKVSWIETLRLRREAKRKIRMHSRNLRHARKEYLQQIKNLRGQLDHNLKSGLTFMFVREYRDNYYQDKLNTIRKRIERKYGSVISRQLKKDSKIQMNRKKILNIMKKLREGFNELFDAEFEKSDGTVMNLLEIESISETQFQLMMETLPILVDNIEENMRALKNGKRIKPIERSIMNLDKEELKEEPFEVKEIMDLEKSEELTHEEAIQQQESLEEEIDEYIEEYDEVTEYPYEKPTRVLIRNANYHYNTCKILLGLEIKNLRGEEFEQICHRLSKELRAKRNLENDEGRLWYNYKCSVEEVNNKIRKLRYVAQSEVNSIIKSIHNECRDFISYYEAYQSRNQKTLKEKIENFYTSTLEDLREILLGEEDEVEENRYNKPDYNYDFTFINLDTKEQPVLERVETEEVAYTPRELDVIPVVRNLSIHDEVVEEGTYKVNQDAKENAPIIVLGVKQENTYTPLFDLSTIEAQIRLLAQQEEQEEEEIYQKAIS